MLIQNNKPSYRLEPQTPYSGVQEIIAISLRSVSQSGIEERTFGCKGHCGCEYYCRDDKPECPFAPDSCDLFM